MHVLQAVLYVRERRCYAMSVEDGIPGPLLPECAQKSRAE